MLVDLSMPLTEDLPVFPGYPSFEATKIRSHEEDGAVSHALSLTTHLGTHVDAPAHFVPGGATVDDLPLETLTGAARVVDLRSHAGETITADVLAAEAGSIDEPIALLLTGDVDDSFEAADFFETAAVLDESGAEWLLEQSVSAVGNDFLTESISVDERPVHHALLGAGVPIVEYLCNVDDIVTADVVEFSCLPLSLPSLEAAPARAVARVDE
ncbi:cyclase family protein [Halovivax limisalsi]|uniref:cyclase family protein n=1 Tax=Halovivax limisalsi TaxID=1453760 RepID=UPI001FFCDDDF|nr:cyclase family protein [Halovivax limisalsi]